MADSSYRALRGILLTASILIAAGGLLAIFTGKTTILRAAPIPAAELSLTMLATIKELGGIALTVSVLLFFAFRDPVRNAAVIDAIIIGLCVLAVTPLIEYYTLDAGHLYPAWSFWGRTVVRLALAAVLYLLRPRSAPIGS